MMMLRRSFLIFSLMLGLLLSLQTFAEAPTPVGVWETRDSKGQALAHIQMSFDKNNILLGKVVKIFEVNGQKVTDICSKKCPDGKAGQRVLGLTIVWGMQCDGAAQCKNGYVLDPRYGFVYHAKLHVTENNQIMKLRGYIGFSLLGKTQDWYRVQPK